MRLIIGFLRRLLSFICILLLVCSLWLFTRSYFSMEPFPEMFHYRLIPVETGEMEPAVAKGDAVILARKSGYSLGDVVAFSQGDGLVLRRLVGASGDAFITKADKAEIEEEPLLLKTEIAGEAVLSISYLGGFLLVLKSPFALGGLFVALLLILLLPRLAGVSREYAEEITPEEMYG